MQTQVNLKEMAKDIKVEIKLKGKKEFSIRTWIASKLVELANWIAWFNIEVEEDQCNCSIE